MTNQELIELYLDSKTKAWAPSTQKSERSRLESLGEALFQGPDELYKSLESKAPYTIKTSFIRASAFFDWAVKRGYLEANPYQTWMEENRRVFKNAYTAKLPQISYSEAKTRISTIPCKATRNKAMQLLHGGLRWSESFTIQNSECIGKGEKIRKVFVEPMSYTYSYSHFCKHLKKIGLKPHDLRKIRATQLARKLNSPTDLCKVFGWESFTTASKYLAPLKDEELMEAMNER